MTDTEPTEPADFKKVRAALYGVACAGANPKLVPHRVEAKLAEPPSYIVQLILRDVLGCVDVGPYDKVDWSFIVSFKGTVFEVRDWRRSTWTVESESRAAAALDAGRELIRKIQASARPFNAYLVGVSRELVETEQIFLHSSYQKVTGLYSFHRDRYTKALELTAPPAADGMHAGIARETELPHDASDFFARARSELKRKWAANHEAAMYGFAAVGFFFSRLEHYETLAFPFVRRSGTKFAEFQSLKWRERFAYLFPISTNAVVKRIYDRLLKVKQDVRDEVFHGFGGEEGVLVDVGGGLAPPSYDRLRAVHYTMSSFQDPEIIAGAFETFDELDGWIRSNSPYAEIEKFAVTGLPVPFYGDRLAAIVAAMGETHTFDEWIEQELQLLDRVENMDV